MSIICLDELFWVRFAKIDTSAGELFLEERHWADAESLEPIESISWQDRVSQGVEKTSGVVVFEVIMGD